MPQAVGILLIGTPKPDHTNNPPPTSTKSLKHEVPGIFCFNIFADSYISL
jgi:hypothetical protein